MAKKKRNPEPEPAQEEAKVDVQALRERAFEAWMTEKYGHLDFAAWERYAEWLQHRLKGGVDGAQARDRI